jgi:high-affinity nickel-transport protein
MYPVGVLFGFGEPREALIDGYPYFSAGFDTASSIALLAISALAKRGSDGKPIPSGYVVLLPVSCERHDS